MWSSKIYSEKRCANLSSLVMENQVEINTVYKNEESIEKLIRNLIDNNESILKLDENQKLNLLLIKYTNIIFLTLMTWEHAQPLNTILTRETMRLFVWHLVVYHTTNKRRFKMI